MIYKIFRLFRFNTTHISKAFYTLARIIDGISIEDKGYIELNKFISSWFNNLIYELESLIFLDFEDDSQRRQLSQENHR